MKFLFKRVVPLPKVNVNLYKFFPLRKVIFLFLFLFSSIVIFGQQAFQPEFSIGIKGGYQFSQVNFNPAVPQGFQPGINGGLVFQFLSKPQIGIQLEINYSQRGWSEPQLPLPEEYRRELSYLEIPFMTHFAIGKKSFRGIINFGSYLSYLLNKKERVFGGLERSYQGLDIQHPWNYGFVVGLGLGLRGKLGVLQLTGRINLGLTDLYSSESGIFDNATEQFFGGHLVYAIRLKKKHGSQEIIDE